MPKIPNLDAQAGAFIAALGDELRQLRSARGWTRQDLADQIAELSLGELASYEFGTRAMGVARLFQLCLVLDVRPRDVLDRVESRVVGSDTVAYIDLARLAQTTVERLQPLRPWAQLRVDELPAGDRTELSFTADSLALDSMASLCGTARADLIGALVQHGLARQHDRNGGGDT